MLKKYLLNLQLFADGAEGDGGGDGGAINEDSAPGAELPAHIPERAKKLYQDAVKANKAHGKTDEAQQTTKEKPSHIPFADLIKSDEYKDEHKAYMDKTIADRFKRYQGVEEQNGKMAETLSKIAVKYGIDTESDDYLETLAKAVDDDDSYVESYAIEHDLSTDEAKKSLEMQRRLKALEEEKRMQEEQAAHQEQITRLLQSAERTKQIYPEFDLDLEMQNEKFRNMCAVTQGDTLTAYRATHFEELERRNGLATAERAVQQVANSVAANNSRPIENGLSSQASANFVKDYSRMSLQQIRAEADEMRRQSRR